MKKSSLYQVRLNHNKKYDYNLIGCGVYFLSTQLQKRNAE